MPVMEEMKEMEDMTEVMGESVASAQVSVTPAAASNAST